ncbi:MAG: N-acetylneuraminate synthase family protein [Candidatus Humimicrobiaceae bacterium]
MRIIADFCQNHNGDFETLKSMINEAANAGATFGKIQTMFADSLSYREDFENGKFDSDGKVIAIKRPYRAEFERLKKLELTYKQHEEFIKECNNAGIIPLTSVFTIDSIPMIKNLGWKYVKIASYDCGSLPLIKELSNHFEELIISTGATYDSEIEDTANYLNGMNKKFSFLHCVTIYPTPLEYMNLKRMEYLRKFTASVGLSEHSLVERDGVKASAAAIYLGADVIERHFTILPAESTKDGKVSIRREHVKELIDFSNLNKLEQEQYINKNIPEFEILIGEEERDLSEIEILNRNYFRGRFCNKINNKQVFNWDYEL